MFEFFSVSSSLMLKSQKAKASVEPQENLPKDAQIYIWTGVESNSVGHVAMQIGQYYFSIWPKMIPAAGPLIIFPLPATLVMTLEEDKERESGGLTRGVDAQFAPLDLNPKAGEPLPPDKVYTVSNVNIGKMLQEIQQIDAGIKTGAVCYQLIPQIKTATFLSKFLSYQAENPFTQEIHTSYKLKTPKVYNCATLVQHLLKIGEMYQTPKQDKWRPRDFQQDLEHENNIQEMRL